MRRIMLVVTVALVMAAMMLASAMPAFAVANENASDVGEGFSTHTCYHGQDNAAYAPGISDENFNEELHLKHVSKRNACFAGNPPGEGL